MSRLLRSLPTLTFAVTALLGGLADRTLAATGPPIGHWKLDETSGSTAFDSAGTNDGTISGATLGQTGQVDGAYLFDGSNDYIELGTKFDGDTITVSAWVNADFPYTLLNFPTIIGAADDFGNRGWNLYYQGVTDTWTFFNVASGSASSPPITSDAELGRGVWQHIVGVGDGSSSRLYIDGELVGIDTGSGTYVASNGTVRIGDNDEFVTSTPFFSGLIDDVCVFDVVLLPAQVKQLYQNGLDGIPCHVVPIGHWKLDETSGSTAFDSAGTNDGTISGATLGQTGQVDGAYLFDGSNDYIELGTKFDGETITVSAWVNADFPYTLLNFPTIIGAADDFGNRGWNLYYQGVADTWTFFNVASGSASSPPITSDAELGRGVWQHIVGVGDGSSSRLYIDGELAGTDTGSGTYVASNGTVRIGDNDEFVTSTPFFPGLIDDVCIFDQALAASQVAQLYQNGLAGSACEIWVARNVPSLSGAGLALLGAALVAVGTIAVRRSRDAMAARVDDGPR